MKLFLVSREDSKINEDIFREPVRVEYDDSVLRSLFDDNNYDTVIVSKLYVDAYGVSMVSKALKTLYKIREYKIIYVSYEKDFDIFVSYMSDTNIIFIEADIGRLTLKIIDEILKLPKVNMENREIDRVVLGKYKVLVENYFEITSSEAREQYVNIHKDELVMALNALIDTALENEALRYKIDELNGRVLIAEEKSDNYLRQLINAYNKVKEGQGKIERLEDQIISYKDSIDIYNATYQEEMIYHSRNKNIILYFQELEDIDFFRFYEAICQYLNIRGLYVKSLILTDKEYVSYAKQSYQRCLDNVTPAFLANCDKLVRIGPAKKLLDLITSPAFKIQIIMIFDRTRSIRPCIESDYSLNFYIGKHRSLYKGIEIPDSSFISPYEGDWKSLKSLLIPTESTNVTDLAYETYANRHTFMNYLYTLIINKQNEIKGRL